MSIPNWSTMYAASSEESAMFFGASGSMAGGQMYAGGSPVGGTYSCRWKTVASYAQIIGLRKLMISGFGSDRSMWQRQIQCVPLDFASSAIPAGCGSWTMT
jgi:hypothetical protein